MTTQLDNPPETGIKRTFALSGPNDFEAIQRIQGLAIQPFIFALCACIPDLDAQIGDNLYARVPHYRRDQLATGHLIQALGGAGYSAQGIPYWVDRDRGEPTIKQIEQLAQAATACLPALADRHQSLIQAKRIEQGREFITRFSQFSAAINEFLEMVENQKPLSLATHLASSRASSKAEAHIPSR